MFNFYNSTCQVDFDSFPVFILISTHPICVTQYSKNYVLPSRVHHDKLCYFLIRIRISYALKRSLAKYVLKQGYIPNLFTSQFSLTPTWKLVWYFRPETLFRLIFNCIPLKDVILMGIKFPGWQWRRRWVMKWRFLVSFRNNIYSTISNTQMI